MIVLKGILTYVLPAPFIDEFIQDHDGELGKSTRVVPNLANSFTLLFSTTPTWSRIHWSAIFQPLSSILESLERYWKVRVPLMWQFEEKSIAAWQLMKEAVLIVTGKQPRRILPLYFLNLTLLSYRKGGSEWKIEFSVRSSKRRLSQITVRILVVVRAYFHLRECFQCNVSVRTCNSWVSWATRDCEILFLLGKTPEGCWG